MADIILDLRALKSKADAAGCGTSATNNTPSLCPAKGNIAGYVTGGSTVVSIGGSYANNLLVAAKDVSISKLSRTLTFTTVVSSIEYGSVGTIVATPSAGAGDGTITYTSSNSNVVYILNGNLVRASANCSVTGSTCTITATISAGTYYKSASCSYTITGYNKYNNHAYVDLQLPSGKLWSKVSIGATTEYGTGNFYSWGNLTGYTLAQNHQFTEAGYTGTPGQKLTSSIPPNATYDVARATWGTYWKLPTLGDITELLNNTTRVWTLISNVYGWKCTSKRNSNYVFFPACGHCGPNGYNLAYTYYTFYMGSTYIDTRDFYGIGMMNNTFVLGKEAKYSGNLVRPIWYPDS